MRMIPQPFGRMPQAPGAALEPPEELPWVIHYEAAAV